MSATANNPTESGSKLAAQELERIIREQERAERIRRDPPRIFTIQEASIYTTLSIRTLKYDIASRRLKVRRRGRRVIIRLEDLEAYLDKAA
jgi:excisionase family DNA binding protein